MPRAFLPSVRFAFERFPVLPPAIHRATFDATASRLRLHQTRSSIIIISVKEREVNTAVQPSAGAGYQTLFAKPIIRPDWLVFTSRVVRLGRSIYDHRASTSGSLRRIAKEQDGTDLQSPLAVRDSTSIYPEEPP